MKRPSAAKAGLIFVLYGLIVGLVFTLLVSTPLTMALVLNLAPMEAAFAMNAVGVVVRAASLFVLFLAALRLPFGAYRLRLVHKDHDVTEVFA